MSKTMSYAASRSGVLLLLHGDRQPSDEDWRETMDAWSVDARRLRADGIQPRSLVYSPSGSGPTPAQRKILDAVNRPVSPQVAVVTASRIARGVVTAISWLGHTDIRAFTVDELGEALGWLGVPWEDRSAVEVEVRGMYRVLSPTG